VNRIRLYLPVALLLALVLIWPLAARADAAPRVTQPFPVPALSAAPQVVTATRTVCASGYYHVAVSEAYNELQGWNRAGTRIDPNGDDDALTERHRLNAFGEAFLSSTRVNCYHVRTLWRFYASDGATVAYRCGDSYEPYPASDPRGATIWDKFISSSYC
jgi:hypothetical protein